MIGKPIINQPIHIIGGGTIMFGKNVQLGGSSPELYSSYGYTIKIDEDVILFLFFVEQK